MKESVELVLKTLQDAQDNKTPFQGILGFSQGGAIATMIASLKERWNKTQDSSLRSLLDLKFLVLCSAFKGPDFAQSPYTDQDSTFFSIPSLHVFSNGDNANLTASKDATGAVKSDKSNDTSLGTSDNQVLSSFSQELSTYFSDNTKEILTHPYGHIIPCGTFFVNRYTEFILKYAKESSKWRSKCSHRK